MTSSSSWSGYRVNYICKYGMPPFLSESNASQHLLMRDLLMPHEERCQHFTAEEWPQDQLDSHQLSLLFLLLGCSVQHRVNERPIHVA